MGNDTQTISLADFLLARIEEDQRISDDPWVADVLAAHRRIVMDARPLRGLCASDDHFRGAETVYRDALRLLALPYADHPDYRDEWKP